MKIQKMFKDDINRPINGVVQVEQDTERVLIQELDEYVVTKELKKHLISDKPSEDSDPSSILEISGKEEENISSGSLSSANELGFDISLF